MWKDEWEWEWDEEEDDWIVWDEDLTTEWEEDWWEWDEILWEFCEEVWVEESEVLVMDPLLTPSNKVPDPPNFTELVVLEPLFFPLIF